MSEREGEISRVRQQRERGGREGVRGRDRVRQQRERERGRDRVRQQREIEECERGSEEQIE